MEDLLCLLKSEFNRVLNSWDGFLTLDEFAMMFPSMFPALILKVELARIWRENSASLSALSCSWWPPQLQTRLKRGTHTVSYFVARVVFRISELLEIPISLIVCLLPHSVQDLPFEFSRDKRAFYESDFIFMIAFARQFMYVEDYSGSHG